MTVTKEKIGKRLVELKQERDTIKKRIDLLHSQLGGVAMSIEKNENRLERVNSLIEIIQSERD